MLPLVSGINFRLLSVNHALNFNLSIYDSPSLMSGTYRLIDSPLSSSITPSLFHSRVKTLLFCKSFPP